jgi:hypothetical protein
MLDPEVSLRPRTPNFTYDYLEYLDEFEAICETALARESWPYGGLFDEKKPEGLKSPKKSNLKYSTSLGHLDRKAIEMSLFKNPFHLGQNSFQYQKGTT